MKNKLKKGFTLVELIVVIAIIAILASVSVAGYFGFIAQARTSAANQEAAQVKTVLSTQTIAQGYKLTLSEGYEDAVVTYSSDDGLVFTKDGLSSLTSANVIIALREIYTVGDTGVVPATVAALELDGLDTANNPYIKSVVISDLKVTSFVYVSAEGYESSAVSLA